jgi:hypothetical protein
MRPAWLAAALFTIVFIVHSASPMSSSTDSRWTVPIAFTFGIAVIWI